MLISPQANAGELLLDVYISAKGHDDATCGSPDTPCQTLDYALTRAVAPDIGPVGFYIGNTVSFSRVRVVAGDYSLQQFNAKDEADADVLTVAATTDTPVGPAVLDVVDTVLSVAGIVVEDTPVRNGPAVVSVSGTKATLKVTNSTFRFSDGTQTVSRVLIKVSAGIATIDNCLFTNFQRLLAVSLIVVTEDVLQFHIGASTFTNIGSEHIADSSAHGIVNVYVGPVAGTSLDVQGSNFTNTTSLNSGGAFFIVHMNSSKNSVVLNNTIFVHTTAEEGSGGAIYYYKDESDVTLSTYLFTYLTFVDCQAGYRGQHIFFRGYDFPRIIKPANFYKSYEPTEDESYLWGWTVVNGNLQEGSLLYYLNQ